MYLMQQERGLCMDDAISYAFWMYNSRNRQEPRNLDAADVLYPKRNNSICREPTCDQVAVPPPAMPESL